VLRDAIKHHQPLAISAISLLEIAILFGEGRTRTEIPLAELLNEIESSPTFQVIPFTVDIAAEVGALGPALLDQTDRAIVATARVRKLKLITADQRIIESGLVSVIF
jgi:PIN domain nuclease of toxin-antitoxin system